MGARPNSGGTLRVVRLSETPGTELEKPAEANRWLAFWNGHHRLYVNDRHRELHYRKIAKDIAALVPNHHATVVDWGCGDALSADIVAEKAGTLVLCDAASATRERLVARFRNHGKIEVLSPSDVISLYQGKVDLIFIVSVLQYLSVAEFEALIKDIPALLVKGGMVVIADVLPPDDDIYADILTLLKVAAANGFLIAALIGLVVTYFSPYRRLRSTLGLTRCDEGNMLRSLNRVGLKAERVRPNIGFNQRRMAFRAVKL